MDNAAAARLVLIAAIVALLSALGGVAAAVLGMPPGQLAPRLWRGYYTILADPSAPPERLAALAAALQRHEGIDAVVSLHSSPVSFNTFDGFLTVPVEALSSRLDPQDPRYDPYLRGLPAYFRGGGGEQRRQLMYVRSERSPAWLLVLLAGLPEARGLGLQVLEAGWAAVVRLALLCAFAALLAARQQGVLIRLLTAGAAVPWLPAVCFGSPPSLLACLALLPLWPAFLAAVDGFLRERLFASSLRRGFHGAARGAGPRTALRFLAALAAAATVFILLKRAGQPLGPAALAFASGLLLLPLLYAGLALQLALCRHVPFVPLPILPAAGRMPPAGPRRRRRNAGGLPIGGATALGMICLAALSLPLLALWPPLKPALVPSPGRPVAANLSWGALEVLAREKTTAEAAGAGGLPDLADYLSHRAYQEGLAFGRPYAFPTFEERLVIPSFTRGPNGQGVVRADRVALRYAEAWLARTLDNAPAGSVARLLIDQGQAVPVRLGNGAGAAPSRPAAALYLCVLLVLGLLLVPQEYDLTGLALCATRGSALKRRQHAL